MQMELYPAQPLENTKLLVADDNEINLRFFSMALEKAGAQVITAANGTAALDLGLAESYHAIVLDLQMPGMSGLEVIDALRANPGGFNHNTPIVVITAHIQPTQVDEVLGHGAQACLIKPVGKDDLVERLHLCLHGEPLPGAPRGSPDGENAIWDLGRALNITGGDRDITAQMLALFLKRLPIQHRTINELIREHDLAEAKREVHKLHGSAQFCATTQLQTAARTLEAALHSPSPATVSQALSRFNHAVEQLLTHAEQRIVPEFLNRPGLR